MEHQFTPGRSLKKALKQNAAAVILAHPHPSGVAEPSQADELTINRLKEALSLIEVRILDHIWLPVGIPPASPVAPYLIQWISSGDFLIAGSSNNADSIAWATKIDSRAKILWEYLDGT
jgi:RadC-like JAB domain